MISPQTIQAILETARIDEVVGDFVVLKKRGVNHVGLCPFHNEKTPSFTVSPSKGIFKCFGCGKGGNSVNFLMEHEHYSYPEALKYLAKKYGIEIEEEEQTPEQQQSLNEKESLFNVSAFAQKFFSDTLLNTEEGKAIGLTYFKERGFSNETIEKFQLGYCSDKWDELTVTAQKEGYNLDYLVKSGLTVPAENKYYDRFRGRVIFPIHNISGRVIGFGGRVMGSDTTNRAKYVNSPESDIYHKTNVLYGLYFAKNSIISADNCYLVEGYTDVISMYQSGVENVVASSGTSLTTEQVKLIRRYTPNVTILYDGDEAGLKASFRGIDMILEEGMNVKIVMFPEGEDPDSFARKNKSSELIQFIEKNAKDFILFKTDLLLRETDKNDPIKKTALLREFIETIALIPDGLTRREYIKELQEKMDMSEKVLNFELNKVLRRKMSKKIKTADAEDIISEEELDIEKQIPVFDEGSEYQEKDIIRLLLNYGNKEIKITELNEDEKEVETKIKIVFFIVNDLNADNIKFENPVYQKIFDEYSISVSQGNVPKEETFINHSDEKISRLVVDLISSPYVLSPNYAKNRIYVKTEDEESILIPSVINSVYYLKNKRIEKMIGESQKKIKTAGEDELFVLLEEQKRLKNIHMQISAYLGIIITK